MKKLLSIGLALALSLGVLSGCSLYEKDIYITKLTVNVN
ncbi:hypothetical protein EDD57_1456 [Baia soyae]|uniref:Uncharacterized protein n=1 Tax=Baia soyae TaxID=1544746 RepID=A0A4R2RMN1_9BACL|nr:hypothetical protein EDD57_1456 [Baia soyae]